MSVYTTVKFEHLRPFLLRYELGNAIDLQPVVAGITNTNYFLDTEQGRFVLTLYEHHSEPELDYLLGLQQHLSNQAVRCARPVKDRFDQLYSILNQRPAAIIHRLPGVVETHPDPGHCASIATELARFHLAGRKYTGRRNNPRGMKWIRAELETLKHHLEESDLQSIQSTLDHCRSFDLSRLPQGAIHADLFHDNALFINAELGGILDFDYACNDSFVFDIAVMLNDWCVDNEGRLVAARVHSSIAAYQQQRRLGAIELDALPLMLRLAALRFWLSRLYDKLFPLSGELTFIKSPEVFRRMHLLRSAQTPVVYELFLPHRKR